MNNLEQILQRLVEADVEFVLVGGLAAVAHGCTLVTRDVDVAIAMDEGNLERVWNALEGTNAFFRHTRPKRLFTLEDARRGNWKNLYLETDLGVLDCIGEVKAIGDYASCRARSASFEFHGLRMRVLDRASLMEAKAAIGRERDRQAVNQLRILESQEERDVDGECGS